MLKCISVISTMLFVFSINHVQDRCYLDQLLIDISPKIYIQFVLSGFLSTTDETLLAETYVSCRCFTC